MTNCYVRPWCISRHKDCCPCDNCEALEPETLPNWEAFELPLFREWCELSAGERGAVLWLALYYMQQKGTTP